MTRTGNLPVWFSADAGRIEDFRACIGQTLDPSTVPLADRVERNVPIYSGAAIRAADAEGLRALQSEWARGLADGAGIIVISGAFEDAAIIDRASDVFDRLIAHERAASIGGGDHFAKPGANDRVWNAAQKHCLADPEGFALYFANIAIAAVSRAWLGPGYQVTAQVNRVNPGGAAQKPHRDYHLGFMSADEAAAFPVHAHLLSPALTLQGAVAHCDMPVETGPTMYLPFSQQMPEGYVAFGRPEFQECFAEHHVQLPLAKGDAVFFNPALMHGAGHNRSADVRRTANLLQVSSAMGRPIEAVDRTAMCRAAYRALLSLVRNGRLKPAEIDAAIAATAEGYAFPTNLDSDPPIGGLIPVTQAGHMRAALDAGTDPAEFDALLADLEARRRP